MNQLDRSQRPSPGPIRSFDFPEVARNRRDGGLDVRVVRLPGLPIVSVQLFVRAGEAALPESRGGVAVLAGDALEGGTRRRAGSELAEALEGLGARLGVSTGWEGTNVSLSCLADRLDEAMGLLAETLLEPAFPESEVARAREQQLAQIRQRAMDPAALASDQAARHYYADGVPYARPQSGTVASVSTFDRDAVVAYAEAAYRPARGGFVVAGDVDPSEVSALADRHLGGWTGAGGADVDFDAAPARRERRVWVVARPGSVQSEIRAGHVGVARSTPDYFPLTVANLVLGGTFTSRLNMNLRERHGFTYGARSRFKFRGRPGPFQMGAAVGNDVTGRAVGEIVREVERFVAEGPTEAEVRSARDYAAGIFALQVETADQIAGRVTQLLIYDLPDDYLRSYRDRIRSVDRDQAAAAVRGHIRPDELQIVVVGDPDAVVPGLEEADVGPVEVVEPV